MQCKKTAESFTKTLEKFVPFPKASERAAYEALSPALRERVIKEGENFLNYEYPAIRATDFMHFTRTGDRVSFENLYFARRHALCGLVSAECVEGRGRFLDDIINGIFTLCEESAWQLPPHNTYVRDKPQFILPDITRPVLDLFACETGALLACTAYLLGKELDAVSPFITTGIHKTLQERIVTPYLNEHFWWMGKGEEPMCNWTAWCTQNVLLAVFLGSFDENTERKVFLKAAESLDYFLKDYGEDGCCDEGAQYYRHAGLCLCNALEILNNVSDGTFAPLFETEKIKNIAAYIMHMHVADKYYFNFSDCSPVAGRAGVQEYLFGKYTGQPALMQFAAEDFRAADGALYDDEVNRINLYHRLQNIFYQKEVLDYDKPVSVPQVDIFYESVGLFLTRNDLFALAVKAGDNADNHNHNDTGSFTLYKNGQPVFADIGVESYTKKTFSQDRYEIWTMQSGYHNLPTLMGLDEKDGTEYCAADIIVSRGDDTASLSMELAGAYPLKLYPGLHNAAHSPAHTDTANLLAPSYRRSVALHKKENRVAVTDTTNLPDVVLNFITYEKPVLEDGLLKIGSLAEASFSGAKPLAVEVLPITDARLQKAWDHDLYRVRLTMTGNVFTMEIA
ncbi:MAG: heparinase II/III-family protein [Lachnospiraceae bacterium]|nr:heparinase II/III-family protein [Lachnospiraceae bacterium]